MSIETSAIIEAIKAGSEKIMYQLYESYREEFVSWTIRNHKITIEEAKDVFQEAMVGLYKNVKAGRADSLESSIKTYLFGIGKNIILNLLKRKGIEIKAYEYFTESQETQNPDLYDREHLVSLVSRIYRALGSPCKEVLELYYERGFDMESVAITLGYKNADVAKKKKYECMRTLEERINMSRIKDILN
ncbi:MAG TPA: sigma-70 family RNA polymerase sigma factor [Cyclobacteriaceae bacterium]|nr:sigma-70 family RNA polymerase sigma factor [Cyclobacteriaceae bacterium]